MPNTIKLKQLDRAELTAFVNDLIDGTGVVYTANRALVTDSSGDVVVSSVTSAEVEHLSGVTSAIQTQLDAKIGTSLTSAYIFVGNVSNVATGVAVSGDITISNTGVTTIGSGKVTNSMLAGSISNAKLTNSSITIGSTSVSLGATAATVAGLTLTSPTINGGTHTAITSLGIRSTGAAYDLTLASSEVLTAGRTLSISLGDVARTLTFSGNATISGTNTGDQTITLTGDVTGSGTGSFAATIANNAVTLAKMATMATASLLGRNTAGTGNVEVLSASTARSVLGLATSSSPQFTAVGVGAAPASPFHITNSSQSGYRLTRNAATTADFEFYIDNSGNLKLYDYAAGDRFGMNTSGRFTIGATFISSPNVCQFGIINNTSSASALIIQAASSQSEQLFKVLNSSSTQIGLRLRKDGIVNVGNETTNTIYPGDGVGTCNIEGPFGFWAIRTGVSNDINFDVYNSGSPIAALKISQTGIVTMPTIVSTAVVRLKGYTVATLPAGTQGDTAFVTDALAPTFLATVVGGGSVVTTVLYNGTNWVAQ